MKRDQTVGIVVAVVVLVLLLYVVGLAVFARPAPGQWYARGWRRWRNPRHWIGPRRSRGYFSYVF